MTTFLVALYIVEPSNNDNIVSGPCIKLGFIGVYIIFLIFAKKWIVGLVRTVSSRRFLRVSTTSILSRNMKNIRGFYLEIFGFWK